MVWDPVWEEVFRQQDWGKYPGEELIRFVARNFYKNADRRQVRILEVGCGPGANLWYLAREGFAVYGVDGSQTAIYKAHCRLDNECSGWVGQLMVGDIGNLDFPDNYFDAVIDNEAICCNSYQDACRIYQEMARVVKPAGKLFSRTFATGTWGEGTGKEMGYNGWLVAEGPLQGIGFNRFTSLEEIPKLVEPFVDLDIELMIRTVGGLKKEIREWIIVGQKAV